MSKNTKNAKNAKNPRTAPASGKNNGHFTEDESFSQRLYYALIRFLRHARRRWWEIRRAKQNYHYPESDRFLIKLVLFIWGHIPMVFSLLAEKTARLNRKAVKNAEKEFPWLERHHIHPAAVLALGCCLASVAMFFSVYTRASTVRYDGEVLGTVSSRAAAESAFTGLETVASAILNRDYTIDREAVTLESHWAKRQDLISQEELQENLSDSLGEVTSAYSLYVAGSWIGSTPYKGALEQLLEQIKASATNEDTLSVSFAEKVEVRQEYVASERIMNLGHLAELLYSTKTEEVIYEVKKGDTWSQIASDHDISSAKLLELNPGYDINKLSIGEELTISAAVPYLTMTVVQQERYLQDVQYEVIYTDEPSMYQGDTKVTSKGSYGAADVVASVTYVNGEETERTVLSSVMLREPVTEHQLQGTKVRPSWYPTGSFRWPCTGRVVSKFGGRKSPGGIGSTNHKGLDIANSRGTPIYAADGGTVVYSGWQGGYGYVVKIEHNNGLRTVYAHNSKLLVKVGNTVHKGQEIAKMGSTGNSTGSHCHFEIQLNGVAQNPYNYLP